ncbi:aldolase [Sphingomonas sp. ID1715]|uniref:HPr kinase/phosphorylase n=1 Tax=Sphingomonas sp. ID1715 TaxID=1656898 RepID=UPI001488E962|nr:HPr kinase/phosphatase C-terminal domain-containing protein [Sphingomonas sp. ID1715]NNM77652.1 aldolase [Sphingomonas sp. ID1715]
MSDLIHATAVAIGDRAVLITGASGAGKSDLALRLIDRGATLISDDQVLLTVKDGTLEASPPERIAGKMEVRGLGILSFDHRAGVPVALLVELGRTQRMPEPAREALLEVAIPKALIDPFEQSAPIKVELALEHWGLRP